MVIWVFVLVLELLFGWKREVFLVFRRCGFGGLGGGFSVYLRGEDADCSFLKGFYNLNSFF